MNGIVLFLYEILFAYFGVGFHNMLLHCVKRAVSDLIAGHCLGNPACENTDLEAEWEDISRLFMKQKYLI